MYKNNIQDCSDRKPTRRHIIQSAGTLSLALSTGTVRSATARSRSSSVTGDSIRQTSGDASGPTGYLTLGDTLVAFDVISGNQIWETNIDIEEGHVSNPVVVEGTVYLTHQNRIYAFDAVSGSREWVFENNERFPFNPAESVTIVDDILYIGGFGGPGFRSDSLHILAFDVNSQSVKWRSGTFRVDENTRRGIESIGPVFVEDDRVYAADFFGDLFVLDAENGEIRDRINEDLEMSVITKYSNEIYSGVLDEGVVGSVDTTTNDVTWTYQLENSFALPPVVTEDYIYYTQDTSRGTFTYILDKSGEEVASLEEPIDKSIIATDDKLYYFENRNIRSYDGGNMTDPMVRVDNNNLNGVDIGDLQTRTVMVDGFIFSTGTESVYCVGLNFNEPDDTVGTVLWEYDMPIGDSWAVEPGKDSNATGVNPYPTIVVDPRSGSSVEITSSNKITGQIPSKNSDISLEPLRERAANAFQELRGNETDTTQAASNQSENVSDGATEEDDTAQPTENEADSRSGGDDTTQSTENEIPGFGVGSAVAALGGAGYMLRKQLTSEYENNE